MNPSARSKTLEAAQPTAAGGDRRWSTLKQDLHRRLIQSVDYAALRNLDETQLRYELRLGAEELCRNRPDLLSQTDRNRLIDELVDETLGLGPLEQLLRDETIGDILVNGPNQVFVERRGNLELSAVRFHDDQHLITTIQKIVGRIGRRIDESSPMVDARLPDGSRVNAIIPPLALDGALLSIRRFQATPITAESLLAGGCLSPAMLGFLTACVAGRVNMLISGGTGSGKTTLLNVLAAFIPESERVVTVEDAAELRLVRRHIARLETRPANLEGAGQITTRDLLRNALRMRPDRIIVGECRGDETLDMLQAMNTGHEGSLTTLHANNAQDAVRRLEMLVGLSAGDLPVWHIDRQIASAVQVIVQVARLQGGVRRVVQVSELSRQIDGELAAVDLFRFEQQGVDEQGLAVGRFVSTGRAAAVAATIQSRGLECDEAWFSGGPRPRAEVPPQPKKRLAEILA